MYKSKKSESSYISINYYLSVLFICGWLLPKLTIAGFNIGLQDLAAVLLISFRYNVNFKIFKIFYADLVFAIFLFFFGVIYLMKGDIEGFLIGCRTLLFVFAALSFSSLELDHLQKLLKGVIFINLLFIFYSITRIILEFFINSFDILNFFYGDDSYRVRSPFEGGGASSQVPIGYMLALILCLPTVVSSKFKSIVFIMGAIGTTSRSSILSVVIVYAKKLNVKKITGIFTIILLLILVYIIYLKSFTSNEGKLDGSANKRLELYFNSIRLMIKHPESLFLGFGLSNKSLSSATGEGFYESFIFNSFMQGGLILFLGSFWILIKSLYYDYKYKMYSIGIVIFLGNAIGGSNYFSMFAYPLMVLIISIAVKQNNSITSDKNIARNYIK